MIRARRPCKISAMKSFQLVAATVLLIAAAAADDADLGQRQRAALANGRIVPLKALLDRIEADYRGQVLAAEFDDSEDVLIYEIVFLTADGARIEFEFDAASGYLLKTRGSGLEGARRR